ncbi:hypothetical protein BH23BAC3_BH23BAC3_26600 [soil metagenome]
MLNMSIGLKKSRKATYNFTNRGTIRQKHCHVTIVGNYDDQMHIKLFLDLDRINLFEDQVLVLEALYAGIYARKEIINPKPEDDFYMDGFPENSNPSFRLKLLPSLAKNDGKILSATKLFKARKSDEEKELETNFLSFKYVDTIGDLIWKINWDQDDGMNPEILINGEFAKKYDPKNDIRFHALILPSIIKEILLGIFIRFNSFEQIDERTQAYRWLKFCDKLSGWSLPDIEEWKDPMKKAVLAEQAVQIFADEKWKSFGNQTLLQKFLAKKW